MKKFTQPIGYFVAFLLLLLWQTPATAESGYDLWLRYARLDDADLQAQYAEALPGYAVLGEGPTTDIIRVEVERGFAGMLDHAVPATAIAKAGVVFGVWEDLPANVRQALATRPVALGTEGYRIQQVQGKVVVTANSAVGLLYGAFHFLRGLQTGQSLAGMAVTEVPAMEVRVLNHWDNLDRTSERGYAGFSIWDWHRLPGYLDQRYVDYARANASLGINGTVLTNVNANALVLTPAYLAKVKALADLFRPYGIKVYLTARFSAPIEIGGLETADPLDPAVKAWWAAKVAQIYEYIPDFGGFLVKANSEGQPGPQNYGRSHAEGANLLADALAPKGGIVMWRAFVYSHEEPEDRAKQAYNEFKPLDGQFRNNVLVQVKNGAIDFQPREPFHPLFGAMPETPLMMEFQITQEYLGQATQWVYLAPMYKECLNADTYVQGSGSTVARVIDGSLHQYPITGIAGVANTGTDRNWTGHPMAQANWYAFGRLAWNPQWSSEAIAREWIAMSFGLGEDLQRTMLDIMMPSWAAAVSYMTPLGLHHQMGEGHHYGPGPWVKDLPRADWTSVYYHKADAEGIGFDRTATGSGAVAQYAEPVAKVWGDAKTCPEKFLLWFHHLSWDYPLADGHTLWEGLALHYQAGVDTVRAMQRRWASLENVVDAERFRSVRMLLEIQEAEAMWWKDACLSYFQTFARRPLPAEVEPPEHTLEYYQKQSFPFAPGIRPRW